LRYEKSCQVKSNCQELSLCEVDDTASLGVAWASTARRRDLDRLRSQLGVG
jgi:hypothetical protein